jgi:LPXTG-motif cell wall-anchored protein
LTKLQRQAGRRISNFADRPVGAGLDSRMASGSGGVGFVIDTATLFLFLVGLSVLAGIWLWLRKKGQKR